MYSMPSVLLKCGTPLSLITLIPNLSGTSPSLHYLSIKIVQSLCNSVQLLSIQIGCSTSFISSLHCALCDVHAEGVYVTSTHL